MFCRCFGKTLDLSLIRQTAESMLGVPDYDAYVAHLRAAHPNRDIPQRDAFLRERQKMRYESRIRCC